jgi:hypothetical protein
MSERSPSVGSFGSVNDAFEDLVADSDISSEFSVSSMAVPESNMQESSVTVTSGVGEASSLKHERFFFSDGSIQFTVSNYTDYCATYRTNAYG